MYLFVPANPKELTDRASWFKKPVARELIRKKDVQFGFELKGDSKNIKIEPPLSWGYHLPNGFSAEWHYHPEKVLHHHGRLRHCKRTFLFRFRFYPPHLLLRHHQVQKGS